MSPWRFDWGPALKSRWHLVFFNSHDWFSGDGGVLPGSSGINCDVWLREKTKLFSILSSANPCRMDRCISPPSWLYFNWCRRISGNNCAFCLLCPGTFWEIQQEYLITYTGRISVKGIFLSSILHRRQDVACAENRHTAVSCHLFVINNSKFSYQDSAQHFKIFKYWRESGSNNLVAFTVRFQWISRNCAIMERRYLHVWNNFSLAVHAQWWTQPCRADRSSPTIMWLKPHSWKRSREELPFVQMHFFPFQAVIKNQVL